MARKRLDGSRAEAGAGLPEINIDLFPRQRDVFLSPAREILFGGAAGGGKSHLLRTLAILFCAKVPYLQAYIFRRLSPDLRANHMDGPTGFRAMLDPWVRGGFVDITDKEIRFWNHATIHLAHCQEERDKYKYQGAEIHLLLIDELTHFTESIYRFLRGRCRIATLREHVPVDLRHRLPLIVCASNPGNVGHEWVKKTFVDVCPNGEVVKMPKREGGYVRTFIRSTIEDNPALEEDYEEALHGLGAPELVEAMRFGNWDIMQGSFFDSYSSQRVFVRPFRVPVHWPRLCSMDWGYYYPFSIHWWAVAQEDFEHPDMPGVVIPFGSPVAYREWYGAQKSPPGPPNRGVGKSPEEVARKILEIEGMNEGDVDYRVADPAIWKSDTGVSVGHLFAREGVRWAKGENEHAAGWMELKIRISAGEFFMFDTCVHADRNFRFAVRSEKNPLEVDSGCEIHACDDARYMCMFLKRGIAPTDRREDVSSLPGGGGDIGGGLRYGDVLAAAEEVWAKRDAAGGALLPW